MKLPDFKVGDTVMLQNGSSFMTIHSIDRATAFANCIRLTSTGHTEVEVPLRGLIRICDPVESLRQGDHVMCRASCEYMCVLHYDADSRTALCQGKLTARTIPIAQLIRVHVSYVE